MAWTWWTRAVHAMGIAALGAVMAACATGTAPRTGRDGSVGPGIDAQVVPGLDAQIEPGVDAYVPPGTDAHVPEIDAYVPPAPDGGPVVGRGAYLDRCTADTDCASGRCVDDYGPTRFCSRACASDLECAHEHLCSAAGVCVHDDTGAPCSLATPATCADGACLGTPGGASCTRDCTSAAECPAGYACTTVDMTGRRVCVDVERPCAAAAECATGLCIGGVGCTAECRTAADCPARLAALGVPPYRCSTELGTANPICIPPSDVVGSDPIGAACRYNASGIVQCRSGACDDSAPLGPMCVQACTAQGGCAPGLGCYPLPDGGSVILVCERAGSDDLGAACGTGRQCHSGLCDTGGYCTRLCADGICPTGWRCEVAAGTGVAICRR